MLGGVPGYELVNPFFLAAAPALASKGGVPELIPVRYGSGTPPLVRLTYLVAPKKKRVFQVLLAFLPAYLYLAVDGS